jgi:trigger factor
VSSGSETVSTSNQLEELYKLPLIEGDYKLSECIKLGNYKGYKLTKTETIVTDAEVEAYIQTILSQTEVQDENATAQLGDTVNMAYVARLTERNSPEEPVITRTFFLDPDSLSMASRPVW